MYTVLYYVYCVCYVYAVMHLYIRLRHMIGKEEFQKWWKFLEIPY